MTSWKLITPYGVVQCHKGRSFGEPVWKKPAPEKKYGVKYFTENGVPLERESFIFYKNKWISSKGDDNFHKSITYKKWVEMGKPKTIDNKKIGVVVKKVSPNTKVGDGATMEWEATIKKKMEDLDITNLVTKNMRYVVPEPEGLTNYRNVIKKLNNNNEILVTNHKVQISSNSSVWYKYAIIPIGKHLVYVEVLDEELEKPFPPNALIPSDEPQEIGEIEEEDVEDVI